VSNHYVANAKCCRPPFIWQRIQNHFASTCVLPHVCYFPNLPFFVSIGWMCQCEFVTSTFLNVTTQSLFRPPVFFQESSQNVHSSSLTPPPPPPPSIHSNSDCFIVSVTNRYRTSMRVQLNVHSADKLVVAWSGGASSRFWIGFIVILCGLKTRCFIVYTVVCVCHAPAFVDALCLNLICKTSLNHSLHSFALSFFE
jgi:hypothetical protein